LQMRISVTVFKRMISVYKKYMIIIHFILVAPILFAFAIFCAGAGHGVFGPYVFLYPYVALLSLYFDEREYGAVLSYSALLLYVIYGVILHLVRKRYKFEESMMIILFVHAALTVSYYLIGYFAFGW